MPHLLSRCAQFVPQSALKLSQCQFAHALTPHVCIWLEEKKKRYCFESRVADNDGVTRSCGADVICTSAAPVVRRSSADHEVSERSHHAPSGALGVHTLGLVSPHGASNVKVGPGHLLLDKLL